LLGSLKKKQWNNKSSDDGHGIVVRIAGASAACMAVQGTPFLACSSRTLAPRVVAGS
jgi:hypothetical protein